MRSNDQPASLKSIREGGKREIARALSIVDTSDHGQATLDFLDSAYTADGGHVIGFTGPPGVGKSTLLNAIITKTREAGMSVAVVAVDPSSQVSRGALLGDRTRFDVDPEDQNIFVRSLAARGALGGLADVAFPTLVLLRALFDRVLVESVGVGQSEAAIADMVDTLVLCVQPGSGDSLQFMKSGIMEVPDICVVTKTDMGAVAAQAVSELEGALTLSQDGTQNVPVLAVSAQKQTGIDALMEAIAAHRETTRRNREEQTLTWMKSVIRDEFGWRGLQKIEPNLVKERRQALKKPFRTLKNVRTGLLSSN